LSYQKAGANRIVKINWSEQKHWIKALNKNIKKNLKKKQAELFKFDLFFEIIKHFIFD